MSAVQGVPADDELENLPDTCCKTTQGQCHKAQHDHIKGMQQEKVAYVKSQLPSQLQTDSGACEQKRENCSGSCRILRKQFRRQTEVSRTAISCTSVCGVCWGSCQEALEGASQRSEQQVSGPQLAGRAPHTQVLLRHSRSVAEEASPLKSCGIGLLSVHLIKISEVARNRLPPKQDLEWFTSRNTER